MTEATSWANLASVIVLGLSGFSFRRDMSINVACMGLKLTRFGEVAKNRLEFSKGSANHIAEAQTLDYCLKGFLLLTLRSRFCFHFNKYRAGCS